MILSRFWYVVLVTVATLATASTLLAANLVNEMWRQETLDNLGRDRFEVEATLKLDARARVDGLAPIAANGEVREALQRASARRPIGSPVAAEAAGALRTQLTQLNRQLAGQAGDLLFAVDESGWIVAAVSPGAIPEGAGLGQFPLVRRALEGNVSDDVWVYNDEVFRMAARPVVHSGAYVGAIVHGKRFDDDLARTLSTRLDGASVAFFRGETVFAGAMPEGTQNAPRQGDMGQLLPTIYAEQAEALATGGRTEPQELGTGGVAVYSLVVGTARHARVGYAIGRPVRQLTNAWDIATLMSGDQWSALPWMYLGPLALFLLLITMLTVWLEHDRPLNRLRAATKALTGSPEDRLVVTDFGGRYRRVTENVNEALEKQLEQAGAAGPKRTRANLDAILGPTPEEQPPSGSFFGFAQEPGGGLDLPEVPPAHGPSGGLPAGGLGSGGLGSGGLGSGGLGSGGLGSGGGGPAGGLPAPPGRAVSSLGTPAAPSSSPAATGSAAKPPPPKPPPPRSAAVPAAPPARPAAEAPKEQAKAAPIAPPPSQRSALKRTLVGVGQSSRDDDEEDGATMVARVPQELLEKSAAGASEEEAHFREVFAQFVDLKKQCGEPTAGLTFEKFSVTLQKNRDQIVSKHGAAKVRFTVYEKGGKAALKATPIKD